ncbi:MAG: IS66 family insertion sequence element accessory protein TnpB [Sphingomonadales bacterium]|nr:IS66 family insertion sequence element accessory protein TnpB [Sphingomonadales bacterium]
MTGTVRFRNRVGYLVKIIWHDDIGMSLYAERLEKGRFVRPISERRDSVTDELQLA